MSTHDRSAGTEHALRARERRLVGVVRELHRHRRSHGAHERTSAPLGRAIASFETELRAVRRRLQHGR